MAKPLRVVSVKEPIRFAGLEVGITSTKAKRVYYTKDSDCGLFSDGSNEMEDKYNSHEEESEEETHEVIPELVTDNPTTDTEADEESGDNSYVYFPYMTTDELEYNEYRITDLITDMTNTEQDTFMHTANELASTDLPIEELKPLTQRFQEGCIGEKKKTTASSMQQVGDTIIYSEDPSGIGLMYLDEGVYEPK